VVSTSFESVDTFDKTRFRLIAGCPSLLLQETESEGRGDALPFHLIAQHETGIVVLSTVVLTSSMGVDSFDKLRFRIVAGIFPIFLWETASGVRGDVLPFHLIKSHIVYEFCMEKIGERVIR
jgi:hypothetical protein